MTTTPTTTTLRQGAGDCAAWNWIAVEHGGAGPASPAYASKAHSPSECLATPRTQYASSLYWGVMTLTTIGYGDIAPVSTFEQCFCIFAMLLGAGYYAYVVGTMCSLVQGLDATNLAFQEQMDAMNTYFDGCSLPPVLRSRIRKFCYYRRGIGIGGSDVAAMKSGGAAGGSSREESLLAGLSPGLSAEVVLHNHRERLAHVPHFGRAPEKFVCRIALLLTPTVFAPNELMTEEGLPNDRVFLLTKVLLAALL